jgi:hypothetical protein
MKTFLNSKDKAELLARLQSVHATTPRRWGKMSAHQMVCHLADGFRLYMSLKTARPVPVPYPRIFLKWTAPWAPIPWPKGYKTAPELDQQSYGTPPAVFADDMHDQQNLVDRFTRQPRDFEWQPHPILAGCPTPSGCAWPTFTWTTTCASSAPEVPKHHSFANECPRDQSEGEFEVVHAFGQGRWGTQVSGHRTDANLGHRVDRTDAHVRHRADLAYVGGFADQEVHVFGHDYISIDTHAETAAHFFQSENEQITSVRCVEPGLTVITAEREEVRL